MNKKIMMWIAAAALMVLPSVTVSAQEAPEAGDNEAWEGAPAHGPAGPGMERPGGPGMDRNARGGEAGDEEETGRKAEGRRGMGRAGMGGPMMLGADEILATIKKYDAAFAAKLGDYKASSPAKYRVILQMAGKQLSFAKMEGDAGLEKESVRIIALEFEVKELARKYDKAADADKAGIKAELKTRLSELFDIRSAGQEMRVARMEKDLAKLKRGVANRKANKARIVEQRTDEMIGEGTGW